MAHDETENLEPAPDAQPDAPTIRVAIGSLGLDALGETDEVPALERRKTAVLFPPLLELLERALSLPGASLVVYRARTLMEFKTEKLEVKLSRFIEDGHASWQIGAFDDHHCHLDLDAVTSVEFSAEPVSCQGGRLNWTVWFESDDDAGNPFRPRAVCAVTLNAPWTSEGEPRLEVIGPVYALYRVVCDLPGVRADAQFLEELPRYG
jgi:hypothetical protein